MILRCIIDGSLLRNYNFVSDVILFFSLLDRMFADSCNGGTPFVRRGEVCDRVNNDPYLIYIMCYLFV